MFARFNDEFVNNEFRMFCETKGVRKMGKRNEKEVAKTNAIERQSFCHLFAHEVRVECKLRNKENRKTMNIILATFRSFVLYVTRWFIVA